MRGGGADDAALMHKKNAALRQEFVEAERFMVKVISL